MVEQWDRRVELRGRDSVRQEREPFGHKRGCAQTPENASKLRESGRRDARPWRGRKRPIHAAYDPPEATRTARLPCRRSRVRVPSSALENPLVTGGSLLSETDTKRSSATVAATGIRQLATGGRRQRVGSTRASRSPTRRPAWSRASPGAMILDAGAGHTELQARASNRAAKRPFGGCYRGAVLLRKLLEEDGVPVA